MQATGTSAETPGEVTQMTEVPKIVHERLRAAAVQPEPGQNAAELKHPDADLLTAFAEQSLAASERESLLEHLAGCGDCREVVMLALPDADAIVLVTAETEAERTTAVPIKASGGWLRSGAFSWTNLWANPGWATLAVAVIVIAAALALRPGSHSDNKNETKLTPAVAPPPAFAPADSQRQIAMATPPQDLPKQDLSKEDSSEADLAQADRATSVPQSRSTLKAENKRFGSNLDLKANQDSSPAAKQALSPAPPPAPNAEYGMLLAGSLNGRKKDSERADRPATSGASFAAGASTGRNTETLEVESAAATVPPETSVVGGLKEREEVAAVEKAKPATQELDANATASNEVQKTPMTDVPKAPTHTAGDFAYRSATLSSAGLAKAAATLPKATWAITAGVLQRSLDGGRTWQSALQADHPLQCYAASGRDVWAGGQAGTLLHSTDGGATWTKVHPSFKEQTLASDVTHIDAPAAGKITVSAGGNEIEIWSSADGGLTWEKK